MFRRRKARSGLVPRMRLDADPEDAALLDKLIERTDSDDIVWASTPDPLSSYSVLEHNYSAEIGGATVVVGYSPFEGISLANGDAKRYMPASTHTTRLRTAIGQQERRLGDKLAADVSSALDRSSSGE